MKRILALSIALFMFGSSYSQVQFFLGARGGIGDMYTHDQLSNAATTDGFVNVLRNNNGWSSHFKGEALLGFGSFRIGYQFLYNFSSATINPVAGTVITDPNRYTTYFNTSQNHFFGHYLLVELAIIDTRHFALTPGIAAGTFTGYKVDGTTNQDVSLNDATHNRFSIGAELNAEIKFVRRWTFLIGPNYYLFSMQDRANSDWREYQHFLGIDAGIRVNLLKVKAERHYEE